MDTNEYPTIQFEQLTVEEVLLDTALRQLNDGFDPYNSADPKQPV